MQIESRIEWMGGGRPWIEREGTARQLSFHLREAVKDSISRAVSAATR